MTFRKNLFVARSKTALLALALLAGNTGTAAAGSCAGPYAHSKTLDAASNFTAEWSVCNDPGGNILQMRIAANTTGWLSIGFSTGQTMAAGVDTAMGGWDAASASAYLLDGYFSSYSPVNTSDSQQDLHLLTAGENSGRTTLEFWRYLSTGDSKDKDLAVGSYYLEWAYKTTDETGRRHTARGATADQTIFVPAPATLALLLLGLPLLRRPLRID